MKILFVAAEAYPIAKTGGLGDVVGALPQALASHHVEIRTLIPAYDEVLAKVGRTREIARLELLLDGYSGRILEAIDAPTPVGLWLLDCPALFQRPGGPYADASGADWADNYLRFGSLCRAAAIVGIGGGMIGWQPDIIHLHDWHAGLVPYYLKRWGGPVPATVFTIHNMAHKGLFGPEVLDVLALDSRDFIPDGIEFWGKFSFLKAALVSADVLTTVSPTYAKEIATPEFGEGLDGIIRARGPVHGILNGIDEQRWSPERDLLIEAHYSAGSLPSKGKNKRALQATFGLDVASDTPLIAVVARLDTQKGTDLLIEAIPYLSELDVQLIVLGEGDATLAEELRCEMIGYPARMHFEMRFDEGLAHRVIAGADMLLMPSRFEPCGLTQLYAQRYGSIPIVHHIGGLADTVHDGHDGFTFAAPTVDAMLDGIRRAAACYAAPQQWRRLQRAAMAGPLSWRVAAGHYLKLYEGLVAGSGQAAA